MRLRCWRPREMLGTSLACAAVAMPLGLLAYEELAEHSV